ncbi:MAG: Na+/H+ antiporter subunit E [Kiritimatiellia bacterium]
MQKNSSTNPSDKLSRHRWLRAAGTFVFALLLWKICTGYDPASWVLGIPAAGLFTWFSLSMTESGHRIHFRTLPAFFVYFLLQSFRAGLDVARRALHPERDINPGFCTYPARLPPGSPRAVFANMISLLPGTLSWSLVDGVHKVHLLSGHPLILEDLAELESRVGKLFGIDLPKELF